MIINADARHIPLRDESIQCCVTSPPYWGLRDYGTPGQLGLEKTPEEYVAGMVAVFREVRRVLKDDGVLWLNLGDSYARQAGDDSKKNPDSVNTGQASVLRAGGIKSGCNTPPPGLKAKDLVGIPWRVAFALQADGWYLRSDIIWAKPNPMPESITDRCTKSHEYIFMLTKSSRYYYDHEAIMETANPCRVDYPGNQKNNSVDPVLQATRMKGRVVETGDRKNRRTVWNIATQPYLGSHFATFPEEIPRLCILAGSRPGDVILDPFGGSGTTSKVALELGRKPVHIDLTYHNLARKRMTTTPAMAGLMG